MWEYCRRLWVEMKSIYTMQCPQARLNVYRLRMVGWLPVPDSPTPCVASQRWSELLNHWGKDWIIFGPKLTRPTGDRNNRGITVLPLMCVTIFLERLTE